jgi:hypothetical protein
MPLAHRAFDKYGDRTMTLQKPRRTMFRVVLIVFGILLLYGALLFAWQGYFWWREAQGICGKDGRVLSENERRMIALNAFIRDQQHSALMEIRFIDHPHNPPTADLEALYKILEYGSVQEFLQINPGCCELTYVLPEGELIDWWARANGSGNGLFLFKYQVRYIDRTGAQKSIQARHTYYEVFNCGETRQRLM